MVDAVIHPLSPSAFRRCIRNHERSIDASQRSFRPPSVRRILRRSARLSSIHLPVLRPWCHRSPTKSRTSPGVPISDTGAGSNRGVHSCSDPVLSIMETGGIRRRCGGFETKEDGTGLLRCVSLRFQGESLLSSLEKCSRLTRSRSSSPASSTAFTSGM